MTFSRPNERTHIYVEFISAYATAERRGEIHRSSNVRQMSGEEYARLLFEEGMKKGWLE